MAADPLLRRVGLRLRITAVAAVAVGIALTVGAVLLIGLLRTRLDTAARTAASLRARDVAALAVAGTLPRQLAFPGEESGFVQVVDNSGTVIAATANIDGEPAITDRRPAAGGTVDFAMTVDSLGKPMRIVAVPATTGHGPVVVYAGESLDGANDTIRTVVAVLALGLPVLVGVAAAVTWWAVGRTLRPVRAITQTMADITTSDLHRRVPSPISRDEIGQLAATVNDTLARLDTSVEQQRRFVTDASHELRGPLAALRADLEISIAHPGQTAWTTVASDTLGDVQRLQQLTDDLLLLARLDANAVPRIETVDLRLVASEALRIIRRTDLTVHPPHPDHPVVVHGDPAQLQRMVRNLVENAERHAATTIRVDVEQTDTDATVTVADDGPGIPTQQRALVLERFVRLDQARSTDNGGTGLGLAIVHDIVAGHHGTITITDTNPHGTTVAVELPIDGATTP